MNILNPLALWFLLAIPPVVILYFMKLKRKTLKVSASFLWDRVMREARVDSFFQKLRVNILLILQILAILFLVAAMIRPFFKSTGVLTSRTIVILDNSASMGAKEGDKRRIDLAKAKINELIDQARSGSRFMLIEVSDSARIVSGFTNDHARIKKLLNKIQVRDTGTDLKPALLLAISLLKSNPQAGILLVGDSLPTGKDVDLKAIPTFQYIPVGKNTDNVAITAFNITRAVRSGPADLFVKVKNFSPGGKQTFLEIYLDDKIYDAREFSLGPDEGKSFVFKIPQDFSGVVKAQIKDELGLDADNTAYGVIRRMVNIPILLVSDENLFLQRAISLLPDVSLEMISPADVSKTDLSKYRIIIWNDCLAPDLKEGAHVFIGCRFENPPWEKSEEKKYPRIISWESTHPLFRFIDLSGVSVASVLAVDTPREAKVLIETDIAPLAFIKEDPRKKAIYLMFDVLKSDWPLSPSFPMFFANAVDYLAKRSGMPLIDNNVSGGTVSLDFIEGKEVKVHPPKKGTSFSPKKASGEPLITLDRVGLYRIKSGDKTYYVSSNLVSEDESMIKPDRAVQMTAEAVAGVQKMPLIREIWWELVLVALLILILEWYVFHRRRV